MFHCGDREALADSLVRLLDDETLRARLGKVGRQQAQLYGWGNVTEAVLDVYSAVLGSKILT
jgi:glycosyltransferase involved in cell wall biosynthesis